MSRKNISTESIVGRIEDIITSDIDNEKVMMSVDKGEYFGLDPIGSRVWEMIEKPIKVSALIDALLLKYDADRAICEGDVLAFLEELHASGLLLVDG